MFSANTVQATAVRPKKKHGEEPKAVKVSQIKNVIFTSLRCEMVTPAHIVIDFLVIWFLGYVQLFMIITTSVSSYHKSGTC